MNNKKIIFCTIFLCICIISFIYLFLLLSENTKKHDTNKTVNIVFTTDVNYKNYLKTTLRSAVASKNKDSVYNINIICVDLSKKDCNEYKKFETENVNVNLVPVSLDNIKNIGNYEIEHRVTRADLFKFFMPDLFPDLDKILYIDVDTAIVKDLTDLYNTNLKDKFIAVVNKPIKDYDTILIRGRFYPKKVRKYNCGVILYNLNLWRKYDISEKLVHEKNIDEDRELMTQNIFNNVLSQNKIVKLAPIYNVMVQWNDTMYKRYFFVFSYFPYCALHSCRFEKLLDNAVIIHYLDREKAWERRNDLSNYWLKYVKDEDYK